MSTPAAIRLLRLPAVRDRVGGLSKVTLWRWCRAGKFPKSIQIAPGVTAWVESEVDEWLTAKVAERDQADLDAVFKQWKR